MKTKALLVSYLPSLEQSNTAKLVRAWTESARETAVEIKELDLLHSRPDFFAPTNLAAYKKRNYMGQTLDPDEAASMAGMDAMTDMFADADHIALAYPMHNFSLPAPVKAFFDAVLQKGRTWDMGKDGYTGLLTGKSALILTSCGGFYEGAAAAMDHSVVLARQLLGFMGIKEIDVIAAQKMNMSAPEEAAAIINEACAKIRETVSKRYNG